MYEENNSQDKPVVIGIDHGFSFMKTKHHIFGNGVVRCNGRPPVAENGFYYDGSYYCIGGGVRQFTRIRQRMRISSL